MAERSVNVSLLVPDGGHKGEALKRCLQEAHNDRQSRGAYESN